MIAPIDVFPSLLLLFRLLIFAAPLWHLYVTRENTIHYDYSRINH